MILSLFVKLESLVSNESQLINNENILLCENMCLESTFIDGYIVESQNLKLLSKVDPYLCIPSSDLIVKSLNVSCIMSSYLVLDYSLDMNSSVSHISRFVDLLSIMIDMSILGLLLVTLVIGFAHM